MPFQNQHCAGTCDGGTLLLNDVRVATLNLQKCRVLWIVVVISDSELKPVLLPNLRLVVQQQSRVVHVKTAYGIADPTKLDQEFIRLQVALDKLADRSSATFINVILVFKAT